MSSIIEMVVYILAVLLAMYGLSAFHFEKYIRKERTKEFYVFYLVTSFALGYLFAQFILTFALIRL
ncbi:DUF1146 domain-containing protein [Tannockella kyphosi]|uniref:DUF1146 domain-containing protein n=1 Tax=Tannockella kyphosi TaxID=2899121 RepID=UPI002013B815|nr:DUF1146 domain-containing protein [Tannockella kyphosi]